MKIGPVYLFQPMVDGTKGKVLICWQGKQWWRWGFWWFPKKDSQVGNRVWDRALRMTLGVAGELYFDHQDSV